MQIIRDKLEVEKKSRKTKMARLRNSGPTKVALVGYTNAGKTTILNALSDSDRSTKDQLFETLETATRSVQNDDSTKPDFVVSDTVGFISKLPTQLVHSFAGTLEIATESDILVLCADSNSENLREEIQTVKDTLADMASEDQQSKTILCLNKSDLLTADERENLERDYEGAILISALEDVTRLKEAIYREISDTGRTMNLLIPHDDHEMTTNLYGRAGIIVRKDLDQGTFLKATVPENLVDKYAEYEE
jgi:GTP-binding protein HflX